MYEHFVLRTEFKVLKSIAIKSYPYRRLTDIPKKISELQTLKIHPLLFSLNVQAFVFVKIKHIKTLTFFSCRSPAFRSPAFHFFPWGDSWTSVPSHKRGDVRQALSPTLQATCIHLHSVDERREINYQGDFLNLSHAFPEVLTGHGDMFFQCHLGQRAPRGLPGETDSD